MLSSKILFLTLMFLMGCASEEHKKQSTSKKIEDLSLLKDDCEEKSDKLACARYGYLTKDLSYTRHACYLGDENSCFNVQEIENRAPNQNFAIINSQQGHIFGCYSIHSIDTRVGDAPKREKEVELIFVINTEGRLASLSVIGEKLSDKFKECVMNSFVSKKFIAVDREQSIRYALSMPEVSTDKRLQGKKPTFFD